MHASDAVQYLDLARQIDAGINGPDQKQWLERLRDVHTQLQAALEWFLSEGQVQAGLQLANALYSHWAGQGQLAEAAHWFDTLLTAPNDQQRTPLTAKALYLAGVIAFRRNENAKCRRFSQECQAVGKECADPEAMSLGLVGLAWASLREQDYTAAKRFSERAMSIAWETGEKRLVQLPLHLLAYSTRLCGELEVARPLFQESLALNRELGDMRWVTTELYNAGMLELSLRNAARAELLIRESMSTARKQGDDSMVANFLLALGGLATDAAELRQGARLVAAALSRVHAAGSLFDPGDQVMVEEITARLRATMSPLAFSEAWAEGRAMTPDEALAVVYSETGDGTPGHE